MTGIIQGIGDTEQERNRDARTFLKEVFEPYLKTVGESPCMQAARRLPGYSAYESALQKDIEERQPHPLMPL